MSKVFIVVFLIFGTVVGSGFCSGKEILVFFSRFGNLSYLFICLAVVMFFGVFLFFLNNGEKICTILENSKILQLIVCLVSVVFCASMFAGVKNLISYYPIYVELILQIILPLFCIYITFKDLQGVEKFNLFVMPITSILFFIVLMFCLGGNANLFFVSAGQVPSWAGAFFCLLYVALNTSMSGLVIARVGKSLSKKQAIFSCLFSCLLLLLFLLLGNFVLLNNRECFSAQMPFLFLSTQSPVIFMLCFLVILCGCLTTLISLCVTLKSTFNKFIKSSTISVFVSVLLPYSISLLGFSEIVSLLYPVCSVLGVFVLLFLFFTCHAKQETSFQEDLPNSTSRKPKGKE